MGARVYSPNLVWQPIGYGQGFDYDLWQSSKIAGILGVELGLWDGTPYESGQSFAQRGADCTGSLFGIVDSLDGRPRMEPPGFPHDASLHDREGAVRAMREIIRRYQPCHKLERRQGRFYVEPGDIVVTGAPGGGPGHVEMVGSRPNELWHALPASGFHQGGWSFLESQVLYAVYRIDDKHRWGRRWNK